jgi:hypothetical protein
LDIPAGDGEIEADKRASQSGLEALWSPASGIVISVPKYVVAIKPRNKNWNFCSGLFL